MAPSATGATIDADELARSLYGGIVLSMRRIKQISNTGEMSLSERAVLSRLERTGPTTAADLARVEHVTAQAMAVTVTGLEARGLIERRPDPGDRRRMILSVSAAARDDLRNVRHARARRLAEVLRASFSADELALLDRAAPLIERLGEAL
jgi:DNA-binding MarR family transcriptional regulator